MNRLAIVAAGVVALVLAAGCGPAPIVVQGTVVSYDHESQTLVVKDERPPGVEAAFSLAGSEVGADPQPGDEVRLAFREEAGIRHALRVMNLTRQAEVGKGAKAGPGAH